jgi:hypothetical protein
MSKAKPVQFVSPKGELEWVTIEGEGKPNLNGVMKYSANLRFKSDDPKLLEFKKTIDAFWAENKPPKYNKMSTCGITEEYKRDEDGEKTDELSGYSLISFKTNVTIRKKDGTEEKKVVKVFDSKANPVNLRGKSIGNGSIGYISGAMDVYEKKPNAGVSLYLNGVQLTKFVEYAGSLKLATPEEGGWTGEDAETGFQAEAEPEDIDL